MPDAIKKLQNATKKIIEKSLLEQILLIFWDWSFDPTSEPLSDENINKWRIRVKGFLGAQRACKSARNG